MVFDLFSYEVKKIETYLVSFGSSFAGNSFPHSDVRFSSFDTALDYCEKFIIEFLKKYEGSESLFSVKKSINKDIPYAHFQIIKLGSVYTLYSIDIFKGTISILS